MADTAVHLTLFSAQKRLTKRIYLKTDGSMGKESAALARAQATRVDVDGAAGLAHQLDSLSPQQALAYGVTRRLTANIGPRDHLRPGDISRSRDNFSWHDGPGVLFLDLDGEYSADDVPTLQAQLNDAMPGIADAPQVWTRSSSAAIHNPKTGETARGGLHCYVIVANANAVPAVGQRLYDGLWLNGHGRHDLSNGENPAALERCLVDQSVWQPERLDYAAPPVVEAPLERTAPSVISVLNADAEPLDPAGVKPLTDAQQATLAAVKRDSKAKATGRVQRKRQALLDALPATQRQQQRQRWLSLDRLTLTPDAPIILESGQAIAAADILANPSAYNGQRCYDPQDPHDINASSTQARIYADDKGVRVWSFAHGGRTFKVLPEPPEEARQAPEDVLALAPEPNAGEVIGACYRHAVEAKDGGGAIAAAELGISEDKARDTWRNHLAGRYVDFHSAAPATTQVASLDDAGVYLSSGVSALIKAKLGSGKSQLAAGIARDVLKNGGMLLSATLLTSLTRANADAMRSAHYREPAVSLKNARVLSSTMHAVAGRRLSGFIEHLRQHSGKVVIDEAAMTADMLLQSGGIMDDLDRHSVLSTLFALRDAGCQFILLDGDVTPPLALLCELLGAEIVECTDDPHPAPAATVWPAQHVSEDFDAGLQNVKSTPCHRDIVTRLARGEHVVIATDSAANAEKLHRMYSEVVTADGEAPASLLLTAENKDMPDQARYIGAPNAVAPGYRLIVHSPVLGAGFSVTSIEPTVYAFITTTGLNATAIWQLVRRFRRARHINVSLAHHLCSPCGQFASFGDVQRDLQEHAALLDMPRHSIGTAGTAACAYMRALHLSNPLHALIGHFENIGVRYDVQHDSDTSGVTARQQVKEIVEHERIESTRTAERMTPEAAEHYCKATPADAAIKKRAEIEDTLCLTPDDLEPDNALPYAITDAALHDDLLPRTRLHAALVARRAGANLDAVLDTQGVGFSGRKHMNEQADIVLTMLEHIGDKICADNAIEAYDAVRGRVRVAHQHLIRPPKVKDGRQKKIGWVKATLERFGHEIGEADKRKPNGKTVRFYSIEIDPHVERFSVRSATAVFGIDCKKIDALSEGAKSCVSVCLESNIKASKTVALAPYIGNSQGATASATFSTLTELSNHDGPAWVGTWPDDDVEPAQSWEVSP